MSAADPQWPAWLRRHTAVELLGPPRLFFAWLTIALSLLMIVYVGAWNAAKYPVVLGYDINANAAYAHILLDQHHIPRLDQSVEAHQPPGYYFVGEIAARAGHEIFGWLEARPDTAQLPEASYRGAQILNVFLVFATALILLALARLVAPDQPGVWAASVAFFAFLPVVSKTAAMFHPETLNMFLSAAALLIATRMMRARRLAPVQLALLALTFLAGFLVRSSTLFTLIAVAFGVALTFGYSRIRLSRRDQLVALVSVTAVVVGGSFLVKSDLKRGLHLGAPTVVVTRPNFWRVQPESMFRTPYRPHFINEALPITYLEIWGDWIGSFAWTHYTVSTTPSPAAVKVLKDQAWIGVLPTLLAFVGWVLLAIRTIRGRLELAALVALPVIAIGGYLYRSFRVLTEDGDLFKATYLLTTAPVWALCFGLSFAALRRYPRVRFVLGTCLVLFAALELRFMLYGLHDDLPIF